MKFTFIIHETKLTVSAPTLEDAKRKVCKMLDIEIGELNKLEPQIFES